MEALANDTHYFTFLHSLTGKVRGDFTISLFKNGALTQSVPVEVSEVTDSIYTASFVNDGTDRSTWTLIIVDPADTSREYSESWYVRSNIIEITLRQLRSRQDADPNFTKRK